MRTQPLHFLVVVDQGTERPNGLALLYRFLDHLDGTFDAKTKAIFIS
jgi:hypothetical protein